MEGWKRKKELGSSAARLLEPVEAAVDVVSVDPHSRVGAFGRESHFDEESGDALGRGLLLLLLLLGREGAGGRRGGGLGRVGGHVGRDRCEAVGAAVGGGVARRGCVLDWEVRHRAHLLRVL